MFNKILAAFLGGIIPAVLGSMVISLPFANNPETGGSIGAGAFFVMWLFAIILAFLAKTGGKAWRRILLLSAVLAFALPLASFLFTGAGVGEAVEQAGDEYAGAAAAGAVIGGGLVTAVSGFIGFFLGVIFLIIGLLIGRDKQVVIIKEGATE